MDPQEYSFRIEALVEEGLMTPDAVLNTLTQRMTGDSLNLTEELPQLHKTFDALCTEDESATKRLSESAFISFLQVSGLLPGSMTDAGAIIYRSLLYLSQAPFYEHRVECLTFDGLLRALIWKDSERSRSVYEESPDTRSRTPADTRRLIFQSFATTCDGRKLPFDDDHARKQAERRAFDFSGVSNAESRREFAKTNYDDDGDETFHDLLDALFVAQPTLIGRGGVHRDGFRPLAKELRRREDGERKFLHQLSIPQGEFRDLVKLLLVAHFGRPDVPSEQLSAFDCVSGCIVKAFTREPGLGITWEMFDKALKEVPELLTGFHRLLSCLYRTSDENDITSQLPRSVHIATVPVLSQLGAFLSGVVSFEDVKLYKDYGLQSTTPVNTATLKKDLEAIKDGVIILLISGTLTKTGEKTMIGYYLPWFDSDLDELPPCLVFQLCPVHSIFQGNPVSRQPDWEIQESGSLVLGERKSENKAMLTLQEDLKRAIVTHGRGLGKSMYAATAWMGDWEVSVDVEGIEVLIEV